MKKLLAVVWVLVGIFAASIVLAQETFPRLIIPRDYLIAGEIIHVASQGDPDALIHTFETDQRIIDRDPRCGANDPDHDAVCSPTNGGPYTQTVRVLTSTLEAFFKASDFHGISNRVVFDTLAVVRNNTLTVYRVEVLSEAPYYVGAPLEFRVKVANTTQNPAFLPMQAEIYGNPDEPEIRFLDIYAPAAGSGASERISYTPLTTDRTHVVVVRLTGDRLIYPRGGSIHAQEWPYKTYLPGIGR